THARKELWRSTTALNDVRFDWLRGSDTAVALVEQPAPPPRLAPGQPPAPAEPEKWLLRVDAARSLMKPIGRFGADAYLAVSTTQPLAAVYSERDQTLKIAGA